MTRRITNGLEDFHWERRYVVISRSMMRYVKRLTNKRERREGRTEAKREAGMLT
jgi:hypothetical protein